MNILEQLNCTPEFTQKGLCYLTIGGSNAYGTVVKATDIDILGIYIPPREYMYPQDYGYIQGYNEPMPKIEGVYQVHHQFIGEQEYDVNVFHIVHFFNLAKRGNPNIIDLINTDQQYHLFENEIGQYIHYYRDMFYSKAMYPRFRGMIKNHMATICTPKTVGGRQGLIEKYGYDTKDAGHTIRVQLALLDILRFGEYGLQTHSELIKDIRNGHYSLKEINDYFLVNEEEMEKLIKTTKLRETVDERLIAMRLKDCLDMFYGE